LLDLFKRYLVSPKVMTRHLEQLELRVGLSGLELRVGLSGLELRVGLGCTRVYSLGREHEPATGCS
jgi:hypothetical protein